MITSEKSSLEEINYALLNHNPFAQPPYLKAQHVWKQGFPDVKSLNRHASDAVFQALEQIRLGQYSSTSILITAQNGTGKTGSSGLVVKQRGLLIASLERCIQKPCWIRIS
jgi:hypothetical protein